MKRESLRDPRRVQEIEALRKPGRARDRDWDVSDTFRRLRTCPKQGQRLGRRVT